MDTQHKKCPYCPELINKDAKKCKHCGEFLSNTPDITATKSEVYQLTGRSFGRGFIEALENYRFSKLLVLELFFVALGVYASTKSWWILGGTILVLIFILAIKPLAIILCILLSACWAIIGHWIGSAIHQPGAPAVIAIFFFVIGLGIHLGALKHVRRE